MKYEKITADQQAQMMDQRLAQYEAEHYQHAVNLALLEAQPAPLDEQELAAWEQAKEQARGAMQTLDRAHANAKKELAKVKKPATADEGSKKARR